MADAPINVADPHLAVEREQEAQPPPAPVDHWVKLFDPADPATPRQELAANYDPHRHIRWENRPSVAELDLAAVQNEGQPLLDEGAINQLRAAGLVNLRSILAAGRDGLRAAGVRAKLADDLYAWAAGRHAASFALAEIAAEPPAPPPTPAPAPRPVVTRSAPPAPVEAGKDEKETPG